MSKEEDKIINSYINFVKENENNENFEKLVMTEKNSKIIANVLEKQNKKIEKINDLKNNYLLKNAIQDKIKELENVKKCMCLARKSKELNTEIELLKKILE